MCTEFANYLLSFELYPVPVFILEIIKHRSEITQSAGSKEIRALRLTSTLSENDGKSIHNIYTKQRTVGFAILMV
jgi:hypothetical protein